MKIRSLVVYSLLRLAFFLVPLGVMMLFPAFQDLWWLAVIFAALIGLSLSIVFLRKPLGEVSSGIHERQQAKNRPRTAREVDDEIEDAANEAAQKDE
ncbi:DUF4229 domain-containing protein [Microbacterium karelineae]|uniref:DUF4229 domain-containing protein n=1 Tax=Microbacterium karelineae TaxID=2654283 RepID=UPI0012EADEA8|nr:DUF4229 domain-containing protein [Microbacterium karelineae]